MLNGAVLIEERVRIPADVFRLRQFRAWVHSDAFPERGRISFLAGEIDVDMSPEELETHNKVKLAASRDISLRVEQLDLGEVFADRALLVNEAADLCTEPDLMFVSWRSIRSGRVQFREAVEGSQRFVEVCGAPDLVVEIVSNTSERKDTQVLPSRYFLAGVREYWLIDARRNRLRFDIFVRGRNKFVANQSDEEGFVRSKVLGGQFLLVRERNRRGAFRYNLRVRD